MKGETDLAHLGSQVQGTDGPGMGVDLDIENSGTGLVQTYLPVPIACCYGPLPQLHGSTWDPAKVMPHFNFPRPKHTPHPEATLRKASAPSASPTQILEFGSII